jgi:phenylalanyl-tRNA synthetase beta chain
MSYAAWAGLDDPVIEIGVTPNRGDALSVRGVARDLAAAALAR